MFLFAVESLQIHGSRRAAVDTRVNDPAKLWNASQAAEHSARHFDGAQECSVLIYACVMLGIFLTYLWNVYG